MTGDAPLGLEGYEDVLERRRDSAGVLCTARQVGLDREVVIRVLRGDAPDLRAFREVSGHPNLAAVVDFGTTATGEPYLVFDCCGGRPLGEVAGEGRIDVEEALRMGAKLAGALAAAHRVGLAGWDLRPESVLLSPHGEPQLVVFGRGGAEDVVTAEDVVFAAPEVLSGRAGTAPGDVWALGVLVAALAGGATPFSEGDCGSLAALVTRVCTLPMPDLRPHGVPEAVCAALERATAKAPSERGDAAALAAALTGREATAMAEAAAAVATPDAPAAPASERAHVPAPPLRAPAPVPPRPPIPRGRSPLVVAGACVGVAVLLAVLAALALRGGRKASPAPSSGGTSASAGESPAPHERKAAAAPQASASPSVGPEAGKLRSALLALGDLPGAWVVAGNDVGSAGLPDADFCGVQPKVAGLLDEVRATYQAAPQGPYVFQAVGTFSPGGAREYVDSLVPAARSCTTWNDKLADGSDVVMSVSAQDGTLGEQSLRFTMGGAIEGGGQVVQVVFFTRRGDTVSATSFAGLPNTVDAALAVDLETRADQKLLQAVG